VTRSSIRGRRRAPSATRPIGRCRASRSDGSRWPTGSTSWDDKHSGAGKTFAPEAEAAFPQTLAFLRSLPFREIGRAVLFGVHSNDHAPFHRDSEPGSTLSVPQSISIYPDARKKLTLASEDGETRLAIDARLFWFNDMDYHGVEAAPEFRWSIRVDGVFEPAWLRDLERSVRRRR
jgi:hypothetical protein